MSRQFITRLRKDQGGVAAVEFALWTTGFFFGVMVAIDFGSYFMYRGKLNTAVGAAAVSAFNTADNVGFNSMQGYVQSLSGYEDATVTLACNGVVGSCTNFSRTCACLSTTGTYASASCGNSCTGTGVTGGSTAGYYFTITATRPYVPLVIANSALNGTTMSQMATVRLE